VFGVGNLASYQAVTAAGNDHLICYEVVINGAMKFDNPFARFYDGIKKTITLTQN